MLLPSSAPEIADLVAYGLGPGEKYISALPDEDTFARAWADPTARHLVSTSVLGTQLMMTSVNLFQQVQGIVGTITNGIPLNVLTAFANAVSSKGSAQAQKQWVNFAITAQNAIIDFAMDAMGAIPIVGWLGRIALGAVKLVMNAITMKTPKPFLLKYSKANDVDETNGALNIVRTGDWTDLFRPVSLADWELIKAEDGWINKPKIGGDTGHWGLLPGGETGSKGLQVHGSRFLLNYYMSQYGAPPSPLAYGGSKETAKFKAALFEWFSQAIQRMSLLVEDIMALTPSVLRVGEAAWSAVMANKTAALYNIDTAKISDEWHVYVEKGLFPLGYGENGRTGLAYWNIMNFGDVPGDEAFAETLTAWGLLWHGPRWQAPKTGPLSLPMAPTIADRASFQLASLRSRQAKVLNTPICAMTTLDQAAFKDHSLKTMLIEQRKDLLQSPSRWFIALEDVPDDEFRKALKASRTPGTEPSTGEPPRDPQTAEPPLAPPPLPPSDGDLLEGKHGVTKVVESPWVIAAVGAASALGLGYLFRDDIKRISDGGKRMGRR